MSEQERQKQELNRNEGTKSAKNAEKVLRMGTAPVGRLMLEFGIPAVASVVLNALYNIIDSIFLGQAMGDVGLAATTVAAPIMTVMIALSVLAGNGGNALCAILLGERKNELAEKSLGNSIFIMIIVSIFLAIVAATCLDPILRLVGATDVTLPYSRLFMQIILFGCIFSNIAMGVNNFIRTAGEPNRALWTMVIGTVVCIALNWLFVLHFDWGVAGSASATVIGQATSAVFVMYYFVFGKTAPFHFKLKNLKPDTELCKRILSLGIAPFALQSAAALTQVIGNFILASLGAADPIGTDGAMASIGVIMKITMFAVFPILGVAIAAQPILGFNSGARKFDRVLRTFYVALATGTVMVVLFFLMIRLFPAQLVGLFGVSASLQEFSINALFIQTFLLPLIAVQIVGSNYFQATGQPMKSTILSLTRQLIFLIPLQIILPGFIHGIMPQFSPLMGFCFTFPIADALSIILCAVLLGFEIKKLKAKCALQHERECESENK